MIKHLRLVVLASLLSVGYFGYSQNVVISEIYGGGGNTGSTLRNDFIELYNPTTSAISLTGWSVQYASATGTTWQVTNLSGSIASRGFYLVQQAQGAGGSTNLPTPDATGTIAMAATAGKVALVNSTTALSGSNPTGGSIVDLVGFGTANGFEGSVGPAPSNSASIERKANSTSTGASLAIGGADEFLGNGYDTNNNGIDFVARTAPQPQNAASSLEPIVVDTTPPTFNSGFPSAFNILQTQFDLLVQSNEIGAGFYVVLTSGAPAPSSTQVKDGQNDQGVIVPLASGFSIPLSNTTAIKTVTGLTAATTYDVYVVAQDGVPNLQASPTKITITTSAAVVPTISPSISTLSFATLTDKSKQSAAQTYTLSASDLTVDLSISVTGNFLISTDNSTYSQNVSIDKAIVTSAQTVYVKFNPSGNVGVQAGTITHSSAGATDKVISLSATAYDPFNQNFNDPLFFTNSGWSQFSKIGAQLWASTNFGRSCLTGCNATTPDKAAQINGFASGAQNNEDWLISPLLDLTGFVDYPALSFWTISAFAGDGLQLKYSSDYPGTGDPSLATWTSLDGKFPASNSALWTQSSNIILPKQAIYVAVVYTSTTAAASRWTFDDWKVEDIANYLDVPNISYSFGEVAVGNFSASKNFTFVSVNNGDITLTPPVGFQVSLDNINFAGTVVVTAPDAVAGKTIYVRFAPPTKQLKWDGSINFSGSGGLNSSFGKVTGSSYPKSETLDIVTYNLEFFGAGVVGTGGQFGPSDDPLQIANVSSVLQTIGADIYGVEEVSNDDALNTLIGNLPGYNKIVSDRWSYSFDGPDPNFPPQKIGFIFNTSTVQVVSSRVMFSKFYDDIRAASPSNKLLLLPGYPTTGGNTPDNFWSSGRLPFMVTFDVTTNGFKKRIRAVVIHAKSGSAQADYDRRKYDVKVLRDSLVANYANDNIVLLGDFNDDVDVSIGAPTNTESTYKSFVDDVINFNALTYPLSQTGAVSFPNSSSFLDHIIISNELTNAYIPTSVAVEDARTYITNYINTTSDHLPVSARFLLSVKTDQAITFTALPTKTFGDAAFVLSAISTSGLPVTYTSSDPTIASISGNTVTILKAGTVNITAIQTGDNSYNAATNVVQPLVINKANQTITFNALSDKQVTDVPFALSATNTSSLPVTFSTTSTKITLAGSQVTIVSAGRVSITANQAGNTNFNAATPVTRDFCIKPAKPIVTVSLASGTATLTSNAASGNQWFLNSTAIAGATNVSYTATAAGTYKVRVTTDDCVGDFSNDTPVVITGDLPSGKTSIALYPNPTSGNLYITGLEPETKECTLVDLLGRAIRKDLEKSEDQHRLTTDELVEGIYFIRIEQSNSIQQVRFIKKN